MKKSVEAFIQEGLRFECQGSGGCCVSRNGYGYVYMTKADRQRMAKALGLKTGVFTKEHCDQLNEVWKLKNGPTEECRFLKQGKCSVYAARPTQCRTWPFWPEVLNAKTWSREVASFCPGVGKGKRWSADEIREQLVAQLASESRYGS